MESIGRPPKLTPDVETRLLTLLRAGVPREVACAGVGIGSRTLRLWCSKARKGVKLYADFLDKLEAAQSEAQSSMLVQIRKAGSKDWKALAWMLERVFSGRYGYKAQVKVSLEDELEKILSVAQTVLGQDAASRLFAALATESGDEEASGD